MEVQNECGIWEKTKGCLVPLDSLAMLPLYHRETIPETYLDAMGHMNVRWYMALFDTSVWNLFIAHGLDEKYFVRKQMGVFALKHFIQYFSEVKVDETVAMRVRMLGRTEKRFHFMNFMINETTGKVASTLEVLGTHADLSLRKAAAMPRDISLKFDARIAMDRQLDWEAPVSGAIQL
ncbi:MAG: thioesterase family protein [Deltaproteobacteria bacterium]|jgi:acyl-CoA thioester hydrolase|nr:thioesterase family protein [Deltaproteobacteria bacterium]